jgi:predicted RNase H-like HicB family nuclease
MAKKVNLGEEGNPADSLRFCAECPEPSGGKTAETIDEMVRSIKKAMELYFETLTIEARENRLSR